MLIGLRGHVTCILLSPSILFPSNRYYLISSVLIVTNYLCIQTFILLSLLNYKHQIKYAAHIRFLHTVPLVMGLIIYKVSGMQLLLALYNYFNKFLLLFYVTIKSVLL